jgi:hypothetical protein
VSGWRFRAAHSPHARFNLRRKSPNPIYSLPFAHLTVVRIHSCHKFIPHPNQQKNQTLNSEKKKLVSMLVGKAILKLADAEV